MLNINWFIQERVGNCSTNKVSISKSGMYIGTGIVIQFGIANFTNCNVGVDENNTIYCKFSNEKDATIQNYRVKVNKNYGLQICCAGFTQKILNLHNYDRIYKVVKCVDKTSEYMIIALVEE